MYTKHLWVLLLCHMSATPLLSQTKTDSVRREKNRHFILSWSTGMLFIHKKPGRLGINFPYNSSNLPSAGQFKSSLGNPFSQDLLLQDLLNVEFYSVHHSIDFHFGLLPNDDHRNSSYSAAYFIAGGYAHDFLLLRCVLIKTGLDLSFYQFSRGLGSIDNRNADISVLGYDSGPSFMVTSTVGRSSYTSTYTTDHLAVDFTQNVLALVPSIRITSSTSHRLYWAVQASWFLPLIDKGGLSLTQFDDAGNRHSFNSLFALIGLDQPGITATLNGRPVSDSPYSFGGLYLGATMGVCVATWHKQRGHSRW
jgi:hypothetical protein